MYKAVFYNVKVEGGCLDPINSVRGVMQGDVLSPCLFNIFIDDIKYIFDASCDPVALLGPDISHLLYADDLILMATSEKGLNNCLARLFEFCNKWELTVNVKKSNVVIFNHTGATLKGSFTYGNTLLQITNQYCYLGIEIRASGSFTTAKDTLAEKARKAMMPLISTVFQFNIPISKAIGLFHSYIKPIILYNAEIINTLTPRQIARLEENTSDLMTIILEENSSKLHLKFLKFILGVSDSCSTVAVMGETGQFPLMMHGLLAMLTNWFRLEHKSDDSFAYLAYQYNKNEKLPWYQSIETIIECIGMDTFFLNPDPDVDFKSMVKNKLQEVLQGMWHQSLKSNKKLKFYSSFKKSFCFEDYLDLVSFYKDRKLFTKFRCSDHSLEIEKGRHYNVIKMNRICKLCQKQVETEKHYLLFCPKFNKIREKSFSECWYPCIGSKNPNMFFKIIKYIRKAEKIRCPMKDE